MIDVNSIIEQLHERGYFPTVTRYRSSLSWEDVIKVATAIGKSRNPRFVLDEENRFVYENFAKWLVGDPSMVALNPEQPNETVPGRLGKGIYIGGNTGSGKSWCLEIMCATSLALKFKVGIGKEMNNLYWGNVPAENICNAFVQDGFISRYKSMPIIGIQDLGREPAESVSMGNRMNVLQTLLEYRGDQTNQITLVTSNLRISGNKMAERYGDRVASRLGEMCNYYELKGKDRRTLTSNL